MCSSEYPVIYSLLFWQSLEVSITHIFMQRQIYVAKATSISVALSVSLVIGYCI